MDSQTTNTRFDEGKFLGANKLQENKHANYLNSKTKNSQKSNNVLKIIVWLFILLILIGFAVFGLSKLMGSTEAQVNEVDTSIVESTQQIQEADFQDDLNVEFNQTETTSDAQKDVDNGLYEIDTVLREINNQTDFEDFGTLNFSQ